MPTLAIIECTEKERSRIDADRARVGAQRLGAQRLTRERPGAPPSYYTLLIRHGIRAPCREGACREHVVWDEDTAYSYCRECGRLTEEEGGA